MIRSLQLVIRNEISLIGRKKCRSSGWLTFSFYTLLCPTTSSGLLLCFIFYFLRFLISFCWRKVSPLHTLFTVVLYCSFPVSNRVHTYLRYSFWYWFVHCSLLSPGVIRSLCAYSSFDTLFQGTEASYLSHPEDQYFFSWSMKSPSGSRVAVPGSFLDMTS